jgi:hypothetical protein
MEESEWDWGGGGRLKDFLFNRKAKKATEVLEPGERFLAETTLNTGSIKRAAYSSVSAPIVKAGVTDRRVLFFTTNNLAFNLNVGKLVGDIPLANIASVECSSGRVVGMKVLKINVALRDGTVLNFEASGWAYKSAEEFAGTLKNTLT